MAIAHHPDEATLLSYCAGSLPEALAAVVASHAAICTTCAREVRLMGSLGARLVADVAPARLEQATPSIDAAPAKPCAPHGVATIAGDVPLPLRRFIGNRLDEISWRRLGPGVWHLPLPLSAGAEGDLRLIKVAAGRAMPEHGHGGSELTLVLAGSYRDEVGTFRAGDVADLDDEVEHQPVADAQVGCICLIASEKKARFKGLIARLVQPFTRM